MNHFNALEGISVSSVFTRTQITNYIGRSLVTNNSRLISFLNYDELVRNSLLVNVNIPVDMFNTLIAVNVRANQINAPIRINESNGFVRTRELDLDLGLKFFEYDRYGIVIQG